MLFYNEDLKMAPSCTQHNIYTTPFKDGAFLFHKSFLLTYFSLLENNPALATQYLDAILNYAFYQIIPDVDSEVWYCSFETIQVLIDTDLGREIQ